MMGKKGRDDSMYIYNCKAILRFVFFGGFSPLLFSLGLFHGLEDGMCIGAKDMEAKGAIMLFLFFIFYNFISSSYSMYECWA